MRTVKDIQAISVSSLRTQNTVRLVSNHTVDYAYHTNLNTLCFWGGPPPNVVWTITDVTSDARTHRLVSRPRAKLAAFERMRHEG